MKAQDKHLKGALLTTAGVLIVSPDALLLRLIDADVWTLLFWRCLLCALGLFIILLFLERRRGLIRLFTPGRAEFQIIGINACMHVFFVLAILNTTVANALVIMSISPLLGAILSRVFLREQVAKRTWYTALVVFAGLAVIFSGSLDDGNLAGNLFAFAVAILMACHFVLLRRYRKVSMIPAVIWGMAATAFTAWPMAIPASLNATSWVYIALLGLCILPISTTLITLGPRYLPAPQAGLIMLLETLFGPLWVWLVIREEPSFETLLGGMTILLALAIMSITAIRKRMSTISRLPK